MPSLTMRKLRSVPPILSIRYMLERHLSKSKDGSGSYASYRGCSCRSDPPTTGSIQGSTSLVTLNASVARLIPITGEHDTRAVLAHLVVSGFEAALAPQMFDYPSVLKDSQQKFGDGKGRHADALRLVVDLASFKVYGQLVIFVDSG